MTDRRCWRMALILLLLKHDKASRILKTSWEGHQLSDRSSGLQTIGNSTSKRSLLRCVELCLRTSTCDAVTYGCENWKGACSFLEVNSSIHTLTTSSRDLRKVPVPPSCRMYIPRHVGWPQSGVSRSTTTDSPTISMSTVAMESSSTTFTQSKLSTSTKTTPIVGTSATSLAPTVSINTHSTLTKLQTTPATPPTTPQITTKKHRILRPNCKCTFPGTEPQRRKQQVVMTLREPVGIQRPVYCLYERNYNLHVKKIGLQLRGTIPHITVDTKMCRVCWVYVNKRMDTPSIRCACSGGENKRIINQMKQGTTVRTMTFDSPSQRFFLLIKEKGTSGFFVKTLSNVGDNEKTLFKITIPLRFVGFHLDQLDRKLYILGTRRYEDVFEIGINDPEYKYKKIATFRSSKSNVFNIASGEKTILRVMAKNQYEKTIIYRDLRAGTTKVMCDHPDTSLVARYITFWRHRVFIALQGLPGTTGLVCSLRRKESSILDLPFKGKHAITFG